MTTFPLLYSIHEANGYSQQTPGFSGIIANFIWLTVELNYRDFVKKHTDVFALYLELLVYTAILIYICDHPEIEIEPSMTEKIIRNTQETTLTMEGYVDTIEIDADPEESAALERIKQTLFLT